jgi:Fe-S-cluster-containing hydrogenase component 2
MRNRSCLVYLGEWRVDQVAVHKITVGKGRGCWGVGACEASCPRAHSRRRSEHLLRFFFNTKKYNTIFIHFELAHCLKYVISSTHPLAGRPCHDAPQSRSSSAAWMATNLWA